MKVIINLISVIAVFCLVSCNNNQRTHSVSGHSTSQMEQESYDGEMRDSPSR